MNRRCCGLLRSETLLCGQIDDHFGIALTVAIDCDISVHARQIASYLKQPEAKSGPLSLCCKEGIKDPRQLIGRDPLAIVTKTQLDSLASVMHLQIHLCRARFSCVFQDFDEYRSQPLGVTDNSTVAGMAK